MKRYWNDDHEIRLREVTSIDEMAAFGLEMLSVIEGDICMVTGPISSGGLGSREKNLEHFKNTIMKCYDDGHVLFDQTKFQEKIVAFKESGLGPLGILEGFYLPLFKSGKIKRFLFIKGWESSFGACWEHDRAKELGIEIHYLD